MATERFANDMQTTLTAGIGANDAVIPVASATGFPTQPQFRIRVDNELMLVTGGTGTLNWDVTRGIENSTKTTHSSGTVVVHILTAGAIGVTSDPAPTVPGLRSLGTGAQQAAAGDDARFAAIGSGGGNPASVLEVFADYANGNDSNDGLSWGSAFKTIQAAYNALISYSASFGSDSNGSRGVGRIRLSPGDHNVGTGLVLNSLYPVELIGTRSGRIQYDMTASGSRIVSTSGAITQFAKIAQAGATNVIARGFIFRDVSFRPDMSVNTALTKCIWAIKNGYLTVDRCSFGPVDTVTNLNTVTAVYHEDASDSTGEAGWLRLSNCNVSRMQLYRSAVTGGGSGGNYNRGRIRDNVVFYGGSLPMIHLDANTNGLLCDGNNLEGSAIGVQIGPNGTHTQNTFLNNSGEDQSSPVTNPFYEVAGSASQQFFIGGAVTALSSQNGIFVRFNHASAYNNLVIGPYDANGTTSAKRRVVDNSTANGNTVLHPNHKLAVKYESGAGAAITDADFTTGPPPNGSLGVSYDTSASVASLFLRANGAWTRISPGGLTTKGDLSTYSTAPTRLGVGTNGQVLTADSTQATGLKWGAPPAGSSAIDPVVRTSDSVHVNSGTTGATLTNDDTLHWSIAGNNSEIWLFECFLAVNAANATMDIKIGWSVPAGTTMAWGSGQSAGSTTVPGFHTLAAASAPTAILTAANNFAYGSLVGRFLIAPSGFVYSGGTAGTITLQFAQNTADAGDLYLAKGSAIRLTKLVI